MFTLPLNARLIGISPRLCHWSVAFLLFTVASPSKGIDALQDAARVIEGDNSSVLGILREMSYWKERALRSEALNSSFLASSESAEVSASFSPSVVSVVESDRALIISAGRSSGAVIGALITTDNGVVAKVVECRDRVAAVIVEQSFRGSINSLKGAPVRLLIQRPYSK